MKNKGGLMSGGHRERTQFVAATPSQVFAFVDDHSRLSSHMEKSSWMTGGGRMSIETDDAKGQAVGSHIRLKGRVLGLSVFLDEIVVLRDPPSRKVWETVGEPRLLVIGPYRMGFDIRASQGGSELRVFIDYDLPRGLVTRWLGRIFGGWYAGWCVDQMLAGPCKVFGAAEAAA
jgi:hypothetical protein